MRYKPSLISLCEIKAKGRKVNNLRRMLRFEEVFVVDAKGKSEGLLLLWERKLNVKFIFCNANIIHVDIKDMEKHLGLYWGYMEV